MAYEITIGDFDPPHQSYDLREALPAMTARSQVTASAAEIGAPLLRAAGGDLAEMEETLRTILAEGDQL